jgi:hypothetical protein
MNKFIPLFLFLGCAGISKAQISAITDNGKQVILYKNGTWKYLADSTANGNSTSDSLKLNPVKFSKSASETFLVKSTIFNIGVFMDPHKWTMAPHRENESIPEYKFSLKSGNGMAMLISEKVSISLENMTDVALVNAQKAALDARVTNREYRIVNGNKILFLEMSGTIEGIKFKYMGYYFSSPKGTMQLLTYTTEELYKETNKELEAFLNGFVVI